ncbi:hypothetical protein [Eubacterium maltosivorans]|uniref:Uncharacterized protein n=1 Tax=Eubacterium maltosivorans TaxID=2041044 RepID=A0A4P9C3A0_EUBML|nr:hypothetical protein [Eubacterium maltosivorans]QCT69757.1 hypothetical protein CPZ25_000010 [Eubacterium maltosivorans]
MNIKYIPVIICGIAFFLSLLAYLAYLLVPVKYLQSKHYVTEMMAFIAIMLCLIDTVFLLTIEIIHML